MAKDEHRKRHEELHRALDELVGDWVGSSPPSLIFEPRLPSECTLLEFMEWSAKQAVEPDHMEID
jgi:hypothetical protein